jgi:hypothetical protein
MVRRFLVLLAGTVTATLLATAAPAAEVIGTIVSADPSADMVVIKTPDGQQVGFRTVETTRILQGDSVVELKTLQPGTQVQILSEPATPTQTGTVMVPLANRIIVAPSVVKERTVVKEKVDRDDDDDDDVDVDVD